MAKVELDRLPQLIRAVEAETVKLPAYSYDKRDEYKRAVVMASDRLSAVFGARYNEDWRGTRFTLAGITATSTGGLESALRNWTEAARRKLREARR